LVPHAAEAEEGGREAVQGHESKPPREPGANGAERKLPRCGRAQRLADGRSRWERHSAPDHDLGLGRHPAQVEPPALVRLDDRAFPACLGGHEEKGKGLECDAEADSLPVVRARPHPPVLVGRARRSSADRTLRRGARHGTPPKALLPDLDRPP
jgi:hypothetical protein